MATLDDEALDSVADALTERGWTVVPDVLAPPEVREFGQETLQLWESGAFRQASVGRGPDRELRPDIRRDYVCWIDPDAPSPCQKEYLSTMEAMRVGLNRRLFLGLLDFEAHTAVYPAGAFYRKHLDAFRGRMSRVLSAILYLNEAWKPGDGGTLRIYPEDDGLPVDILPEGGQLVVFLADRMEHEVLPANRQRISVTGWFRRRT